MYAHTPPLDPVYLKDDPLKASMDISIASS